jgi:HK97 gp10 family phage protein
MEFKNLGDMALFFAALPAIEEKAMNAALEVVAAKIEETAKEEIGRYQEAIGPFPAWAQLASSTESQKTSHGYPANSPLLASGDMRDFITHEVDGNEAIIGSTDPVMAFHEKGTMKMPPRPVMGPALEHNREFIKRIIGRVASETFTLGVSSNY